MTDTTPKPIDTHYNGYKFRSRLEARWAIFFDELHIPYAYEPEGFDLNGTWYLPDFHLTNGLNLHHFQLTQPDQIWVEIKPDTDLPENDRQKIAEFVKQTDHHILLISGHPDINTSLKFIDHHPETGWFVTDVRWLETNDGQIGIIPTEKLNNTELLNQISTPRLRTALDKARQSRFEHKHTVQESRVSKICRSCGQEFRTYYKNDNYCRDCYYQQKNVSSTRKKPTIPHDIPVAVEAPSSEPVPPKESSPKAAQNMRRLVSLLALIIISGLIGMSIWTMSAGNAASLVEPTKTAVSSPSPTNKPTNQPTTAPTNTPIPQSPTPIISTCYCTSNTYDCADFDTQAEAQACYDRCLPIAGDIHKLDSDEDGKACISLP